MNEIQLRPLNKIDYEAVAKRRDMIRSMIYRGCGDKEVIENLSEEGIYPATYTFKDRVRALKKDLEIIANEDAAKVEAAWSDETDTAAMYIQRQKLLYYKAISQNKLDLARQLSQDIARAEGLATDEPVRGKRGDDLGEIMKKKFVELAKKMKPNQEDTLLPESQKQIEHQTQIQPGVPYSLDDLLQNNKTPQ